LPNIGIIGSGGLRSGLDLAKAIALGADLGASAAPNLLAQNDGGSEAVYEAILAVIDELRISMFCTGAANLAELRQTPLYSVG